MDSFTDEFPIPFGNACDFLERVIGKPFEENYEGKDLLETTAKYLFDDVRYELASRMDIRVEKIKKEEFDCRNDERAVDDAKKKLEKLEEYAYWHNNDNAREELNEANEHLQYVQLELKNQVAQATVACEDIVASYLEELTSTQKESENNNSILTTSHHTRKGGLAEAAVQHIFSCFNVPMVTQLSLMGSAVVDIFIKPLQSRTKDPILEMFNEVKCVETLGTHDISQFGLYLKFAKAGKHVICYHFLRLFRHQKTGFKAWHDAIKEQLYAHCINSSVPVFAIFYEQPLLQIKITNVLRNASCNFDSFNSTEMLNSAVLFPINKPATNLHCPLLSNQETVPWIWILAADLMCNPRELKKFMIEKKWKIDKYPHPPTDFDALCFLAVIISEFLQKAVILDLNRYKNLYIHYQISKSYSNGLFAWSGPNVNGLLASEDDNFPSVDEVPSEQFGNHIVIKQCPFTGQLNIL